MTSVPLNRQIERMRTHHGAVQHALRYILWIKDIKITGITGITGISIQQTAGNKLPKPELPHRK